jgi:hypothetical protein
MKVIDNDEKAVSLLIEGINYAKKNDLHWNQRGYSSFDSSEKHKCGTFCCILGHIGNKYGKFIKSSDDMVLIANIKWEQQWKLTACFLQTTPQDFVDTVKEQFGAPAMGRVVRAARNLKILEEKE